MRASSELNFTQLPLPCISFVVANSNFVIFSDSMSSLEALNGVKFELNLVQKIIKDYTHLTINGKTIIFCWIPSHVNIPGNEKPTLQLNQLWPFPLQKWNSQHMILFLASRSFVLKKGRISGIVARAINFMPSTQLWVLLNTIKLALAVRWRLSTDFD